MEMEVGESESDDGDRFLMEDTELVRIPEHWLQDVDMAKASVCLPDNLYVLSQEKGQDGADQLKNVPVTKENDGVTKREKKWGLVLIEKRPTRNQFDGRTMMEKAQERKRMANLDGGGER
jgi:hypothetical protein